MERRVLPIPVLLNTSFFNFLTRMVSFIDIIKIIEMLVDLRACLNSVNAFITYVLTIPHLFQRVGNGFEIAFHRRYYYEL